MLNINKAFYYLYPKNWKEVFIMSIIKNINNVKPFETIPRKLLQQCDKKRSHTESKPLSLQAIGLLCNLQSYPENWEIHKTELYNRYEKMDVDKFKTHGMNLWMPIILFNLKFMTVIN